MEDYDVKLNLVDLMRRMYELKLIGVLDGNASYSPIGRNYIYITPSGIDKYRLKPEHIITLYDDGRFECQVKGLKPSIEYRLHLKIHNKLGRGIYVLHSHNPYTLLLTLVLGRNSIDLLMKTTVELGEYISGGIGYVSRYKPGSLELAESTAKVIEKPESVVLLEGHGVVSVSTKPERALHYLVVVERSSMILYNKLLLERCMLK